VFSVAAVPILALALLYLAIGRYRRDAIARVAGVAAALGGTLGASLVLPQVNQGVSTTGFVVLAVVALILAVGGSVYAERRLKRVRS
jgi:formate hydrogenlyase subunit 3/multisubunit Na+/H+ antiporter MnhD subunit